eukprot:TRINITY_DN1462_c0_g1_i1.p1 TRINITY_DN1462_c0_g1~~TRINITY_DN1462_c0_g1_i1.p1  ORF type:complete len:464 (-),score=154.58 TRINITY_DN1462_c0_g1_i1:24-1415(-)
MAETQTKDNQMKLPTLLNELFSVVSYNGNEMATKNKDKYLVDNVLKKEIALFHCSGKGKNFDLVLESKTPFTLTNILVRKPPRGCTSPIRSGAIWISSEAPSLESYTEKYNDLDKEANSTTFSEPSDPAVFFLIDEDKSETQVELPTWKTGRFLHIKFISAAKADTRYKNIDVGFVGLVGYHGDQLANQHPVGAIPLELDITNKGGEVLKHEDDIGSEEMKLLKSQLGKGNAAEDGKFIINKKSEKIHLAEDAFEKHKTLYLKNLEDCVCIIDAVCTKIFVESCKKCKFTFNGNILTNIVECWKVDQSDFEFNAKVFTLQLDICSDLQVNYAKTAFFQTIVWAGVENLKVSIVNSKQSLATGFTLMKEKLPHVDPNVDQFITRLIDGHFRTEQVVRLANGFPTTEREAVAFELKEERNRQIAEQKIRQIIKSTEIQHKKVTKVGRNDNCPCGKGQKYKKCCGK